MDSSFLLKFVCLINEILFGGSDYFGKAMVSLSWADAARSVCLKRGMLGLGMIGRQLVLRSCWCG